VHRCLAVILAALTLTVVACDPPSVTPPPGSPTATAAASTPAPKPSTSPVTISSNSPAAQATAAPATASAQVVKVIDGDTIDVSLNGKAARIRIIGIDTPETVDPREPVQCFGREASARTAELVSGKSVQLVADPTQDERDRYNRLLRYVEVDGKDLGLELIRGGYAHEYTYDVPYQRQAEYKAAYREAREKRDGLWSPTTCNGNTEQPAGAASPQAPTATTAARPTTPAVATRAPATPTPARAPAAPTAAAAPPTATLAATAPSPTPIPAPTAASASNCHPSYPDVCIPPPPPDLDCPQIPFKNIRVLPPDPHRLDGNKDGVGCES
jgi:micrococcal nuclease